MAALPFGTVLIVEDDPISDLYLTEILKNHFQQILHAKNGFVAIELVKNYPGIELIMMDLKMPVMDGITATKEIRKFNKEIIIIAETAYAAVPDRIDALQSGCTDYISKPINDKELLALVYKYLGDI